MKQYKDLNLKKLREDNDLDFAHFTYKSGQCSCCYGPQDMAARYWKNGKKPEKIYDVPGNSYHYEINGDIIDINNINYILFKNANNGSGIVTKNDFIKNYTCVSYSLKNKEQITKICEELMKQLDEDYIITIPKNDNYAIVIYTKDKFFDNEDDYRSNSIRCISINNNSNIIDL